MSFRLYGAGDELPPVYGRPLVAGEELELGSLLLVNSSGEYAECGTDPSLIAATALEAAGTGTGPLFHFGTREFPPGEMIGVLVEDQTFSCEYVGTIGSPTTNYGVTKGADGIWRLDFAKTGGTARVKYIGNVTTVSATVARVVCRFLAANVQSV